MWDPKSKSTPDGDIIAREECSSRGGGELLWDPTMLFSHQVVSYLDFFYTNSPKWDMQRALDHLHCSGYNETVAKHIISEDFASEKQGGKSASSDGSHVVWESDKFLNAMLDTNKDFDEMRRRFYPNYSVKELVSFYYQFKCTNKGRNWATMYKKTSTNGISLHNHFSLVLCYFTFLPLVTCLVFCMVSCLVLILTLHWTDCSSGSVLKMDRQ
jgi:hypothetical protein